jgi:uncharacterized Rossmann fold enzyme
MKFSIGGQPLKMHGIEGPILSSDELESIYKRHENGPAQFDSRTLPPPKLPIDEMEIIARMRRSLGKYPSVGQFVQQFKGRTAMICGGGPSIADQDSLKALRAHRKVGAAVVAVNKTIDFLADKGIDPDIAVMLDAQQIVSTYVQKPHPGTRFFLASQCHDDTFSAIEKLSKHVFVWHCISASNENTAQLAREEAVMAEFKGDWIRVAGGTTVGLRALFLMIALGFEQIHLLGFDSSFRDGGLYGYHKANASLKPATCSVKSKDGGVVDFKSNIAMARQSDEFRRRIYELEDKGHNPAENIKVHGTGAIPYQAALMGIHAKAKFNANPRLAIGT